jgi:hypothetical protein
MGFSGTTGVEVKLTGFVSAIDAITADFGKMEDVPVGRLCCWSL